MSRTTISIRDEVFERLAADKGDTESWSGYLERLADGERIESPDDGMNAVNALTADDVPMLADCIADEVENRMMRR